MTSLDSAALPTGCVSHISRSFERGDSVNFKKCHTRIIREKGCGSIPLARFFWDPYFFRRPITATKNTCIQTTIRADVGAWLKVAVLVSSILYSDSMRGILAYISPLLCFSHTHLRSYDAILPGIANASATHSGVPIDSNIAPMATGGANVSMNATLWPYEQTKKSAINVSTNLANASTNSSKNVSKVSQIMSAANASTDETAEAPFDDRYDINSWNERK